ncbi:MAG: aminoacyl-tRNA hydrolase [Actinomycetota bacterium]
MSGPALVVGLGNPGPEYARTRHNLGFRVVETLAARLGARLKPAKGIRALVAETRDGDHRIVLAQPTTFMNASGEAVRALARYFKVDPTDVVIVHDELDPPVAQVKVKRGGGDAGHNGLKDITKALGTPDYARVRIGIGKPPGRKQGVDHVLAGFTKKEEALVDVAIEQAADAAITVVVAGVEAAQQRFHAGEERPAPPARAVRKEVTVDAPVEQVWEAWTTPAGARTFFAPDARIELRPGGAYEIYFLPDAAEGDRGSDGCKILAYRRPEFLVFSWNAPPSIPAARHSRRKTRVEVRVEPAGARTSVTLTHSGWPNGPEWDEAFAYFEDAWDTVLGRLKRRFESGPIDWPTD